MKFQLIEIGTNNNDNNESNCFPDFFDDCGPNSGCDECVPVFDEIPKEEDEDDDE